MNPKEIPSVFERAIAVEAAAFTAVIVLLWCNEWIDIPHYVFGAEKTVLNWRESLFESVCVLFLGIGTIYYTRRLFMKIRTLEGILPVCAGCKKIRDEKGEWFSIESYISERSDASFSHGICPECAKRLYPDIALYKDN